MQDNQRPVEYVEVKIGDTTFRGFVTGFSHAPPTCTFGFITGRRVIAVWEKIDYIEIWPEGGPKIPEWAVKQLAEWRSQA